MTANGCIQSGYIQKLIFKVKITYNASLAYKSEVLNAVLSSFIIRFRTHEIFIFDFNTSHASVFGWTSSKAWEGTWEKSQNRLAI